MEWKPYTINWNNNTNLAGPHGEGYCEWWEVKDPEGSIIATCHDQCWADTICSLLNKNKVKWESIR